MLLALLLSLISPAAEAALSLRVLRYENLLEPGAKLRCNYTTNKTFGFLLTHTPTGEYHIDTISNGNLEGEKTRQKAVLKDYGTPLVVYVSANSRVGDFGSYFEFLIFKKLDSTTGTFAADVMFTDVEYVKDKVSGEEKEVYHPISKQRLACLPE